jgi:hypothetical protein
MIVNLSCQFTGFREENMSNKEKPQATSSGEKTGFNIWTVIIPAIVAIIVGLFSFPPFVRLFDPRPTATTEPTLTTSTVEPISTETYTPVLTETFTLVPATETASVTSEPQLPIGMQVSLIANQTRGKVPLKVRLNTKDSFFRDPSGAVFPCGACNYTWQVRTGGNILFGPQKGEATFEYTFRDRGTYFVTIVICRNQSNDCGSSGALIVAE